MENDEQIKSAIQKSLGKEVTAFALKGKGAVNNAYYVETADGGKYIVKQERADKEFQPQNDLKIEAAVIQQLERLSLSISIPHVVFISENPHMYGYVYIEGDLLRSLWPTLSEEEKVDICETLGRFHAEIGEKFTKDMAVSSGIVIDDSKDLHPEVKRDYEDILASSDVPEGFKTLAKKAKKIFDGTFDGCVFQFLHNDSHHENILIKDKKISGIIDFGNAEYGETAKEFSRYIRDFPNHFQHIVNAYEKESGNKLSYERLVSNSFISGLIDNVEDYRKGGEKSVKAENAIQAYYKLLV